MEKYKEAYTAWLEAPGIDEETKAELRAIEGDEKEIEDRFYKDLEFGTGGFASMVLLCGLTVNAGIYILCEYNNQREAYPAVSALKCYLRAYSHKVTAVFLTTLSTVLGLVPFYIDGAKDSFWFSFAVGSTGGLLFSILALVLVMPIFIRLLPKSNK